ncbi:hypothetical protein Anas_11674 [Armadillidium nasatum]|uniref:Uncharacterized protein n=1 Tax=Armadillidium nasatum TaxID=96803 RepID=A0A5N5T781_9CRUS|nr:hypothetical protein Anas_11674 [Armadillidium nasatum]
METDNYQVLEQVDSKNKSNFGFYLAGITGGIALLLSVVSGSFISPALRKVKKKKAAAKEKKFHATGVELNPWLVWYSRFYSWNRGITSTRFICKDLWKVDLSNYENIVIFGVQEMMEDLQIKLKKELGENSCIVACRFPLPSWSPVATFGEGINTVWLYEMSGSKKIS